MKATELLAELEQLVKAGCDYLSANIVDAQYDGDNDSAELVITCEDGEGGHQEFVISSVHVQELEDEDPGKQKPPAGGTDGHG